MRSSGIVSGGLWVGAALLGLLSAMSACGGRTVLLLASEGTDAGTGTGTGVGTGTGTGTGSGPGTGIGSGPGTGFGSGSGSACEALATCCTELTEAPQNACEEIVASNIAAECNDAIEAFQLEGLCNDESSGSGSGSEPESEACLELGECCMGFPSDSAAEAICRNGITSPSTCSADLQELNVMQLCGSPPPVFDAGIGVGSSDASAKSACGLLDACCVTLPAQAQAECESVVASGVDSNCSAVLQEARGAGFCL